MATIVAEPSGVQPAASGQGLIKALAAEDAAAALDSQAVRRVGLWSAVFVAASSVTFSVTGLLALLGILPYPWDPVIPDGASLVLAVAFVIMMVCVHQRTPPERSLWSQLGLAFALLYAGLVSIVYIVTLTVVVPVTMQGQAAKVAPFVFDVNGSFMSAVDGLGYTFMSLATWLAAPAFLATGPEKWLRRIFLINGVMSIVIVLAYMPLVIPAPYYQVIEGLSSLWILSLPTLAVLVARHFRGLRRRSGEHSYNNSTSGLACAVILVTPAGGSE